MDSARDKIANTELSPEEVYGLGRRCAEGDLSARETLILAHLPLVKKMANKFKGRGVDYDDLYQEGCYGLIEAVIRYDYTKGTPLGAYAYYWINKRIRKALLTQSKNIPMTIGEKDYYTMCRVFRAYHDIYAEKGHIPHMPIWQTLPVFQRVKSKSCSPLQSFFHPWMTKRCRATVLWPPLRTFISKMKTHCLFSLFN